MFSPSVTAFAAAAASPGDASSTVAPERSFAFFVVCLPGSDLALSSQPMILWRSGLSLPLPNLVSSDAYCFFRMIPG
jgi:hypothetical protein